MLIQSLLKLGLAQKYQRIVPSENRAISYSPSLLRIIPWSAPLTGLIHASKVNLSVKTREDLAPT